MKSSFPLAILLLAGAAAALPAQTAPAVVHKSELGFGYTLPGDWEIVDTQSGLATVKQKATASAGSDEEKKGVACVEMDFTARHGSPASVIVEVALPFACVGQQATDDDLPGFANGALDEIKQSFDLADPVHTTYTLGSHHLWIERARGTVKNSQGLPPYTIEIACSLLKRAAVCWMTMAADDAGLATFESGVVNLDSDAPTALVPATVFAKKPL